MRGGRVLPYLLIAPATVFLAVLFLVPLVQTIALAFQDHGAWSFSNFSRMSDDLNFSDAVVNSFRLVIFAVPVQFCLALGMAMMLRHVRRGRDILLWIWSIPLGISDLAAGVLWLAVLTDQGYLNSLLFHLGVIDAPVSWLTYETPVALFFAVAIAEIWRATAIVLLILVAGVQVLPKEYGEAAAVFGASPWRGFVSVTLPLLKSSIQTALILRTVLAFEAFAVVLAIGGRNFPVLVSEAYNWQHFQQDTGVAAAYAMVVMAISIAATLVYLAVLRTPPGQRA
jgi:multiple sugar transport system permease protein